MPDITCKRCSIFRVNQLCDLYEEAFTHHDKSEFIKLKKLVEKAADRGYAEGAGLLQPNLDRSKVRSLSWNVSSLLTDSDLEALGMKTPGDAD